LDTRQRGKVLDIMQQNLRSSVVALVVGLSCVCASVQLKIQLTLPGYKLRAVLSLLFETCKEIVHGVSSLDVRQKTNLIA